MQALRIVALVIVMAFLLVAPMVVPVARHEEGAAIVYTFPRWEVGAMLTGGVLALSILWRYHKSLNLELSLALFALGFGLPLLHVPTLLLAYVRVDDEHFEGCYGSWGSFTRPDVRFNELREIHQIISVNADGRGSTTHLVCVKKSGTSERINVNDILVEPALSEILHRAHRRNVLIRVERRRQ